MVSEKCKEDLFWEINKRKLAFSGVLTLYVSEREGEWKETTSLGVASSWDHLGHWESSSAKPAFVCSSPLLRATPIQHQFKEAFPPHKSPTRPLLLVLCLERNINTPVSCLYSCPLKLEFCPLRRGGIQWSKSKLCDGCSKALLSLVALGHGLNPV